jgi:hypothetical protein
MSATGRTRSGKLQIAWDTSMSQPRNRDFPSGLLSPKLRLSKPLGMKVSTIVDLKKE